MRDVLVRSFAPLNALDNVLQIGLFTVASLGGGTVLGVEYGPWQGAVATSGLVAVLLLFGALRTQVELENLRGAPRPHLKFLDGQIEEVGWLPRPQSIRTRPRSRISVGAWFARGRDFCRVIEIRSGARHE